MPFPAAQRVVYRKNPLNEVICQLRFPPILEIGAESPWAFQKQIRDSYPLYESEESAIPKEFAQLVGQLSAQRNIRPPDDISHKFLTEDRGKTVSLTTGFLAIADTQYQRWEEFSGELSRARRALEKTYSPSFYTRIGLRYIDVIDKQEIGLGNEPWEKILKPELLGLLGVEIVGPHVDTIKTEASIRLQEVDQAAVTLRHGFHTVPERDRKIYVIDADMYTTRRSERDDVDDTLATFHRIGGNLFQWAIGNRLHEALGPSPLE